VGGRLLDMQTPGHLYAAHRLHGHLQRHPAAPDLRIALRPFFHLPSPHSPPSLSFSCCWRIQPSLEIA
jgi:hypothetical protein